MDDAAQVEMGAPNFDWWAESALERAMDGPQSLAGMRQRLAWPWMAIT